MAATTRQQAPGYNDVVDLNRYPISDVPLNDIRT